MRSARRNTRVGRDEYFRNVYRSNARTRYGRQADNEGLAGLVLSGALLLGTLLMAPAVLRIFGVRIDVKQPEPISSPLGWCFWTGVILTAAAFAWRYFGDTFAAWNRKRRLKRAVAADMRKNAGRIGGR